MSTPTPYGQVPDAPPPSVPLPPAPPAPAPPAPAPSTTAPAQPQQAYPQQGAYPTGYAQPQPSQQQQPYGATTQGAPQAKKSGKVGTVIATALVTATVSVLATLFATGSLTAAPLLEQEALESGVSDVLSGDFELTDVKSVSCPAEAVAERGEQFECTFTSGGEKLSVPVEVLNDDGQYRVGGPLTEEEKAEESADEG